MTGDRNRRPGTNLGASLFVRRGRKIWTCCVCKEPIPIGQLQIEYLGESGAYESGTRYHLGECFADWERYLLEHHEERADRT